MVRGRTWPHTLEVVGLRFRWKRDGRRALSDMIVRRGPITGVTIVREPDNPYDENALAVFLPDRILAGKQLGYLHRETAELLAPKIDDGTLEVVSAELRSLDHRQDYNIGELGVRFRDLPKKRSTKPKGTAV